MSESDKPSAPADKPKPADPPAGADYREARRALRRTYNRRRRWPWILGGIGAVLIMLIVVGSLVEVESDAGDSSEAAPRATTTQAARTTAATTTTAAPAHDEDECSFARLAEAKATDEVSLWAGSAAIRIEDDDLDRAQESWILMKASIRVLEEYRLQTDRHCEHDDRRLTATIATRHMYDTELGAFQEACRQLAPDGFECDPLS